MSRSVAALVAVLCLIAPPALAQDASSRPTLFLYKAQPIAPQHDEGTPAQLNVDGLLPLLPGSTVDFLTPDGRLYVLIFDRLERTKSGNINWLGHLRDGGPNYRVIIIWGAGGFGHISTSDGDFKLETIRGDVRLIDLNQSKRIPMPMGDDVLIPPPPPPPPPPPLSEFNLFQSSPLFEAAIPSGTARIDVMVLYSAGLEAKLGPDSMRTRIEYLVALANQAFLDSQVEIEYRLVHTGKVNYPESNSMSTTLDDISNDTGPFAGVGQLRTDYGADLVGYLKQNDSVVDYGVCGNGFLNGANGTAQRASNGFAVARDGRNLDGSGAYYCTDYSLTHEFGHNMGLAHDRANETTPGVYPYSYGYGISGVFGTIMSYINPRVGKYSNPNISCALNQPCGISENDPINAANNALSLNNTRWTIAGFKSATGLDTTPDVFSFTNLIGVNAGDTLYSEQIVVSGLLRPDGAGVGTPAGATAPISITGGEYSVDGASFTNVPGTVANGQTVQVRVTAPTGSYSSATAMLTIGTTSRTFCVVTSVASLTTQPALAAGNHHSLALRADGTLWAWGRNDSGQLGNGTLTNQRVPVQVPGLIGVTSISAGGDSTLVAKTDGTVWVWGNNTYKQLGDSTGVNSSTPKQLAGLSGISKVVLGDVEGFALGAGGSVWAWGWNLTQPTQITSLTNAIAIAAGLSHRLVLLSNGTVWGWGWNRSGQLGDGSTTDRSGSAPVRVSGLTGVTAIAAAGNHSLALLADGTVWAWGENIYGQLGDGTKISRNSPTMVSSLADVASIGSGSRHSLAVKKDGSVWAWGDNAQGQLGDGTLTLRLLPTQIAGVDRIVSVDGGGSYSIGLRVDGSMWAWGDSYFGETGTLDQSTYRTPSVVSGGSWVIGAADMEPSPFSFSPQATDTPGAVVTSNAIAIAGFNLQTPITILGGQYSINGGSFTALPGMLNSGDTISVRATAPAVSGASTSVTVTIGGVRGTFNVNVADATATTSTLDFVAGWNLMGNGSTGSFDVVTAFSDASKVSTVWKWIANTAKWAFYAPLLTGQTLTDYANAKGYDVLTTINGGEGFWVNVQTPFTAQLPVGAAITSTSFQSMASGWNLIAIGESKTPSQFNALTTSTMSLTTLWAWDAMQTNWYFYAPSLESSGGLSSYITSKGYLDFTTANKTLGPGVGFWVNRP